MPGRFPSDLTGWSYSRLAPPQLVLPLVAFQMPSGVVALVQAGAAVAPSVGAGFLERFGDSTGRLGNI